ncbi:MAG: glutamate 5-kinase, partial [Alphaproteobacteria bacterium]|nr:glutamate 5-kinase [Alphaproteobacteria bacterium]
GSGGMVTKIMAARIAVAAGCHMAIASGRIDAPLTALEEGARATWFIAHQTPKAARKQWILGTLAPAGRITIDSGAARALREGKSLLPAGVIAVEGAFGRGDNVAIADEAGRELGRGLIAYGHEDARAILRRKTADIEAILGYRGRDVMIHRDDLALIAKS